MKITENAELASLSYLKIGGQAKYFIEIENENELQKIVEIKEKERLPVVVLGSGSNTAFNDNFHNKVFVKIAIDEILKVYEDKNGVNIDVGAGTNWDKLVEWTVKNKLSGLELLSGIPGLVGASPIQNIGAYGGEISNTLTHVKLFDLESKEFYEVTNRECNFDYRDSIFKKNPGRFIITRVAFRLSKEKPSLPQYKDIALYFLGKRNKNPTLKEIRQAVIDVRNKKLPDPKKQPNCGSFFKNPIVDKDQAESLTSRFKDIPNYRAKGGQVKLSGGWLIEKSGFKGKDFGNIKVSDSSALVLISNGKATFRELIEARDKIIAGVKKNFDVDLEVETNLVY